jgi:hypothetical protein
MQSREVSVNMEKFSKDLNELLAETEGQNPKTFIAKINEQLLTKDTWFTNHCLASEEFEILNRRLLKFCLNDQLLSDQEFDSIYRSYLKVFLVKTNFKFLRGFFEEIFDYLSTFLDGDAFNSSLLSKTISLINTVSGGNVSINQIRCFSFLGEKGSGLLAKYDKLVNDAHLDLNQNFTYVMMFFADFGIQKVEDSVVLLSYLDEPSINGYSLFVKNDNLYFSYAYTFQMTSASNELLIFENISQITQNKWSTFMISCSYESHTKTSNLIFILNDVFKSAKCPLNIKLPITQKQNLKIFENVSGSLSLFAAFEKCINLEEFKRLRCPLLSQGVVNAVAYDYFVKIFEKEFIGKKVLFLLTGMSSIQKIDSQWRITEHIRQTSIECRAPFNVTDHNQSNYDNDFISLDVISGIFSLFCYIAEPSDMEILMKIVSGIVINERVVQTYFYSFDRNLYLLLMATILVSGSYIYFNSNSIETLIGIVNMQNEYRATQYLNEILLGFTLLDKFLCTEANTKRYFDLLIQNLDFNSSLSKLVSPKSLLDTLVLLMHSRTSLNTQKAFQLSRILLLCMPVNKEVANVDLLPVLLLMSQIKSTSPENHPSIINVFLRLLKVSESRKTNKQLYIIALGNMLQISFHSATVEKVIKQMLRLDFQVEEVIISFWRMKVSSICNVEQIRDVYCAYNETCLKLTKSEKMNKFLLRMIFDLKPNEQYYGDNMNLVKSKRLNIFYELTVNLDESSLEKILQAKLISLRQSPKIFIRNVADTNFITWIICISHFNFKNRKTNPIFDLSSKLLANFLAEDILVTSDASIFGRIFEILSSMHQNILYREVICAISGYIFKELVNKDVVLTNENSLNEFLTYFFWFYFQSLKQESENEQFNETMGYIIICLHKNVNNNTNQMLPLAMQKSLTTVINIKNNIQSLIQNSAHRSSRTMELDSVLKIQCYLFIDIAKYCFELGVPESTSNGLMLVREYFANTMYFLEKNRNKLRDDKVIEIENVLLKILLFLSSYPEHYDKLKEIGDSMIMFTKHRITPSSFSCQILEKFQIDYEEIQDSESLLTTLLEIVHASKEEKLHFGEELIIDEKVFISDTLIEIKHLMGDSKNGDRSSIVNDAVKEKMGQYRFSNAHEYKNMFSKLLNEYFLDLKIHFQYLRNSFHKLYKHQRQPGNLLYRKNLDANIFHFQEGNNYNKNYDMSGGSLIKIKHSKATTKSIQRPFLKIKPSTFWKKLAFKNYDEYIDKFSFIDYFNFKAQSYFPCERIYKLSFVPGFILLNRASSTIEFLIDFQTKSKNTGVELSYYKFKPHKKVKYLWNISAIKQIHEFKFFNRRLVLEFFTIDKESFLMAFKTRQEMDDFVQMFFEINKDIKIRTIDTAKIFEMKNYKKRWLNNDISNFEYLMKVNSLSSRSMEDFSQYPVMPLLIKRLQPGIVLRELNKPIGMVGDDRRVDTFLKRYQLDDPFSEHPNYFYGSHYSSPAILFNFLIRLRPYNKGCKAIQNGVFDLPDRLFFSINLMLKNVMEEMGDVREFIPELFYLPIIYINSNNFDFGVNQNGVRINNVAIPDIFQENPFKFVYSLRRILESVETSKALGDWIDLIFGSKQTGHEAIDKKNVFFYLTYEDSIRKIKFEDAKHKTAIETQIYHFGQVPFKLFSKKHANKHVLLDHKTIISSNTQVKYFVKMRDEKIQIRDPIFFIKSVSHGLGIDIESKNRIYVYKKDFVELYKFQAHERSSSGKPPFDFYVHEHLNISPINNDLLTMGFDFSKRDVIEIYAPYRVVYGGLIGGLLAVFSLKTMKQTARYQIHESEIIKLALSKKNILLTADAKGIIIISDLDPQKDSIIPLKTIFSYFNTMIVSLSFSHIDQNFFIVNSDKIKIEVRSIYESQKVLFRLPNRFTHAPEQLNANTNDLFIEAQLSFGYISCVVVYSFIGNKNTIHSFSLDGRVISQYSLPAEDHKPIKKMVIVSDEYFKDNLILVNSKGDLYIFELPLLENGRRISSSQKIEVSSLLPFNKNKILLLADQNGLIDIFTLTGFG